MNFLSLAHSCTVLPINRRLLIRGMDVCAAVRDGGAIAFAEDLQDVAHELES